MNDTCPNCLRRGNQPLHRTPRGGATQCTYRCRCGHTWTTTWTRRS